MKIQEALHQFQFGYNASNEGLKIEVNWRGLVKRDRMDGGCWLYNRVAT